MDNQFDLISIGITLNLQNLSSKTRLLTNFKFNNILYKFGSVITVINSNPVALFITSSGYFISDNNFHISSFIKLSSSFNISNNKFILSSSKGTMKSSSFLTIFLEFFCCEIFFFSSISLFILFILFSSVKYITVFSTSPLFLFKAIFNNSSSYILNTFFSWSHPSFNFSSEISNSILLLLLLSFLEWDSTTRQSFGSI